MAEQENITKPVSRASLDRFDLEGVQELSQTFSQSSTLAKQKIVSLDGTLAPEEPSSLEKALRAALERYGFLRSAQTYFPLLTNFGFLMMECLLVSIGNMIPRSRRGSLVYTSRVFALLVLAPQHLIKQQWGRCSIRRLSGGSSRVHYDRPRGQFSMTSAVW